MNRWLLIFLLALTGFRLFLGAQSEISPDESYYFQWSQRLDWAYFSKGPGVAAAIRAGTSLFGPVELGVRFLSPLLALGTSLVIYAMARRLYSEQMAIWAVLLINVTPIFQAGSLVMTIDALSIFFWAAALWTFWIALERSPKFSWFWPLTGALIGLGFLAKYTNAMELLSIVLVLALTPKFRQEFRKPGFWMLLGVFLLAVIPPVLWNYRHSWITLEHMSDRGGIQGTFRFRPDEALAFFGIHFGVYSPLIFGGMLAALVWGCREARLHFKPRFLVLFSLPLLVMYFGLSIKHAGQPNWTAPAFVSLCILSVAFWYRLAERAKWARVYSVAGLALGLFMSLVLVNPDGIRRLGFSYSYDNDPGKRLRGWKTIALAVDELRQKMEQQSGKPLFLIADKYQTASLLSFYLPNPRQEGPGHPPVYMRESQAIENQYAFWPRYDQMIEPTVLAKTFLKDGKLDVELREALAGALREIDDPKVVKGSEEAIGRRRALLRALLAVRPDLPIDEYASEELGISLFYGRDALYISDSGGNRIPSAIENAFENVEMIALWNETRRGLPLRAVRVFLCRNYRTLPL